MVQILFQIQKFDEKHSFTLGIYFFIISLSPMFPMPFLSLSI